MASTPSTGSTEELAEFFDHLVRCETRLYNVVGERLRAEHGIAASQFELLRYLRDRPRSRVADIATHFAAGIGAISKGVDRLEARGWLSRSANPADRRSSLISLTAAGAALADEAGRSFREHLRELVGVVGAEEVASASGTLAALRRSLEQARLGVPTG